MATPTNGFRQVVDFGPIDRIDHRILCLLQKNARMTHKELGAVVGLAPSSVHTRVKKLIDAGAIRGFHADVAPRAVGIGLQALISVKMTHHARKAFDAFRKRIAPLEEVRAVYQLAGANDFLVHVATRDADHLRDVVLDTILSSADIAHCETSVIFDHQHLAAWPSYAPSAAP
jgi:DNA-binding Lrp family transcriptional regulator